MGASKLQAWVEDLSLMEQGTVLTAIRGNDLRSTPETKKVQRWIRALLLINGNPENDFMAMPKQLPTGEEVFEELEYMTMHFFLHFLHTLEIIGYKHPDEHTGNIALDYYMRFVAAMHLKGESPAQMASRLSGEPGTTHDAIPWRTISREMLETKELCPTCLEFDCVCVEIEAEALRLAEEEAARVAAPVHEWSGNRSS